MAQPLAYTPPGDAREFVPVMRYSPLYRFFAATLMPAIAWATLIAGAALPFLLLVSFWPRIAPDERLEAVGFGFMLAAACLVGPIVLLVVTRIQRRDIFERSIYVDQGGVTEVRGSKVKRCRWPDTRLRTIGLRGRAVFGWLRHPGGRIWLDGRLVPHDPGAPPPRLRLGWTTSYIVYPDGRRREILFTESELYRAIQEHLPQTAA